MLRCRIKNQPLVYVVGDSHTLSFSFHHPFITCHLGPVTAYNILKENSTTSSKKKLFSLANKINKKKDILVLVFGEIDCRIHIFRRFKKSNETIAIDEIIDETIKNYFVAIEKLLGMRLNVIVYGVPPANYQENVYGYDYYAEASVQADIKKIFNKKMKEQCYIKGVKYIEIFYTFSDRDGFILPNYSSDQIHLNNKIIPFIQNWFKEQKMSGIN